jgi:hypothetical protein
MQFRRDSGGTNFISLSLNFANGIVSFTKYVGGSTSALGSGLTFGAAANTDYHVTVTFANSGGSTTVSLSLNGTVLVSGVTISDAALQAPALFVIGTDTGSVGSLTFTEVSYH